MNPAKQAVANSYNSLRALAAEIGAELKRLIPENSNDKAKATRKGDSKRSGHHVLPRAQEKRATGKRRSRPAGRSAEDRQRGAEHHPVHHHRTQAGVAQQGPAGRARTIGGMGPSVPPATGVSSYRFPTWFRIVTVLALIGTGVTGDPAPPENVPSSKLASTPVSSRLLPAKTPVALLV